MKSYLKIDYFIIAAFITFISLSACNSTASDERESEKLVRGNSGKEVEKLNDLDASFLQDAALLDLKMISVSRLVNEKSKNKETQDLAQTIASVHEKSYNDIKVIGEEHNQEIPNLISESDKIEIEKLAEEKENTFDIKLLDMLTRDHNKYLPHFEQLAEKADNASVKNWSSEFVPSCKRIVEQVAQISKNTANAKVH